MANSSIALISAKEFETARRFIPELSQHLNYEDWLDYQFGRMMGASLGGDDSELVTVSLDEFLNWCRAKKIHPSERALDVFSGQRDSQAEEGWLAA